MYPIPLGNAIAIAAAFLALGGVFFAFIHASQKKHQAKLDLLRFAVERGATLDPELIDKLAWADSASPHSRPRRPGRGSLLAGILIITYAVGFAIFACFIGAVSKSALIPMLGVSALFLCIGIGFLIVSIVLRRDARDADPKS